MVTNFKEGKESFLFIYLHKYTYYNNSNNVNSLTSVLINSSSILKR